MGFVLILGFGLAALADGVTKGGWELSDIGVVVSLIGVAFSIFVSVRLWWSKKRLEKLVMARKPHLTPVGKLISDQVGESYKIKLPMPFNRGGMAAHNVRVSVVFPPDAKISHIASKEFYITEGGVDEAKVVFQVPILQPNYQLASPEITVSHEPEKPVEFTCSEMEGVVTIPIGTFADQARKA